MREKIKNEPGEIKFFASMMKPNLKTWLMALFVVATMALFSGCAPTGDDAEPTTPPDDTAMPTEPTEPTEPPVVTPPPPSPYQVLVQGQNKAKDAMEKTEMALKDAMKYSDMISPAKTGGDSMKAMSNAQMVLDTKDKIEMYLMNAKDARKELVDAKEGADDAAMKALDKAIMGIDGNIKTIQGYLDDKGNDSLEGYILSITGTGDKLKTASDRGQEVGMAIFQALKPAETMAGLMTGTAPTETTKNVMKRDNSKGVTWVEIVGSDKIMDTRIVKDGKAVEVKVSSVDGDSVQAHTDGNLTAACAEGNTFCDKNTQHKVKWKGIDGQIVCQGDNCKLTGTGDDRALTGAWYFNPDMIDQHYLFQRDRTYKTEMYAEYGYWLTDAAEDGTDPFKIHTYSDRVGGGTATGVWNTTVTTLASKATYSGGAIGMYAKFSGSGDKTVYKSGHFSADVELNATFGPDAAATLGGTIDNFRDANNMMIDSNWSVKLDKKESVPAAGAINDGMITNERNGNGAWTATSIAESDAVRPEIIHGTFNAHFSNGDVAGAYATRKD